MNQQQSSNDLKLLKFAVFHFVMPHVLTQWQSHPWSYDFLQHIFKYMIPPISRGEISSFSKANFSELELKAAIADFDIKLIRQNICNYFIPISLSLELFYMKENKLLCADRKISFSF